MISSDKLSVFLTNECFWFKSYLHWVPEKSELFYDTFYCYPNLDLWLRRTDVSQQTFEQRNWQQRDYIQAAQVIYVASTKLKQRPQAWILRPFLLAKNTRKLGTTDEHRKFMSSYYEQLSFVPSNNHFLLSPTWPIIDYTVN